MSGIGGPRAPFGGNLLPRGAIGGSIEFRPGGQHVSITTDGAHVSYDVLGNAVSGIHGTLHDVTGQGVNRIIIPKR